MTVIGIEWIIIGIVAFVIFLTGGKKITEFARSLGRAVGEFKKGKYEVEKELKKVKKKKESK